MMFTSGQRHQLYQSLIHEVENFLHTIPDLPVTRSFTLQEIRQHLTAYNFLSPQDPETVFRDCMRMLTTWNVHNVHPRYFGWFNPDTAFMSILADALVATTNPQLAVWANSPVASEIESHLIQVVGERFGFSPSEVGGSFTAGGAEANLTAVLMALTWAFPSYGYKGLRSLPGQPVFYLSEEGHHTLEKIAHTSGLGRDAMRMIPVLANSELDLNALTSQLSQDRSTGFLPFLVIGTAGTTNAGAIDPLPQLAILCEQEKLWFHVDAASGGAVVFSEKLQKLLNGIEQADSITFDAHKWLSMPMGTGMFLTKRKDLLGETFHINTSYATRGTATTDSYTRSLQWSRRFIGLRLFMTLAVEGFSGLQKHIEHLVHMGDLIRARLQGQQWCIDNTTPLPVICFHSIGEPQDIPITQLTRYYNDLAQIINENGRVWLSASQLGSQRPVLRVCVANGRTSPTDIDILIEELEYARDLLSQRNP